MTKVEANVIVNNEKINRKLQLPSACRNSTQLLHEIETNIDEKALWM